MTFLKAVVTAILLSALATGANANSKHPAKKADTNAETGIRYLALVMANENDPNQRAWVSVAHAVLVRATARSDRSIKNAATEKGQFTKLVKQPTPAMMKVAAQMYRDWKNGKPTIEVQLQEQLDGCSYFHNPTVNPAWARKFRKLGGYCGFVEGHYLYRDPRNVVTAYN